MTVFPLGISACLIVRDEADQLAACLTSLAPHVDEIVVADTGSTDDTVIVARELGAEVVHVRWVDSFAAARNAALQACSFDWVLSVDADERAVARSHWQLGVLLAEVDDDVAALNVEIVQEGASNPRGHTRQYATKLFRRSSCQWRGRVHEWLTLSRGPFEGAAVPTIDLPPRALHLVHHGYASPEITAAKAQRNLALAHLELTDRRTEDAPADDIARALLDVGRSQLGLGERRLGWQTLGEARHLTSAGHPVWLWATDFLAWDAVKHEELPLVRELTDQLADAGAPQEYLQRLRACIVWLEGYQDDARTMLAAAQTPVTVLGEPA